MGEVDLGPAPLESVALEVRASRGTATPTAIGWIAEQWSCSTPGTVSSALRVPPPIVSAASSTVTATPSRASATAQASPFGPEPTTIAVLTRPAYPLGAGSRRSPTAEVTSTGKSQDSSIQGPRSTISATSTQPSSIRPVAAS